MEVVWRKSTAYETSTPSPPNRISPCSCLPVLWKSLPQVSKLPACCFPTGAQGWSGCWSREEGEATSQALGLHSTINFTHCCFGQETGEGKTSSVGFWFCFVLFKEEGEYIKDKVETCRKEKKLNRSLSFLGLSLLLCEMGKWNYTKALTSP